MPCFRPETSKLCGRQTDEKLKKHSHQKRKRALKCLIFHTEKTDGTIMARHGAHGSPQRNWMRWKEVSRCTVTTKSTSLAATIEAEGGRYVATCDMPNAFIQSEFEKIH